MDIALANAARTTQGLKVVLTLRPESFQFVQRRASLSTHQYFQLTNPQPEPTSEIRFTTDELPSANEPYRRAHRLQTDYANLSPSLREAIAHPWTLQVLAQNYEGRPFPYAIETTDVVQNLVVCRRGIG